MNVEEIKSILKDQKDELKGFLSGKIIERDTPEMLSFLKTPNVLALLGVRRCGKSTLAAMLLMGSDFGYVNFDDERLAGITSDSLNKVLQAVYELEGSEPKYLLFDEIQDVKGWELFVGRMRRSKRVVITGSNAKLLSGELATHLTGRYIDFTIFPFSFKEFLRFNGIKAPNVMSTFEEAQIKREFERYLNLGGFPEALTIGKAMLPRLYGDILQKDLISRYKIRNSQAFRELAKYLISNAGREVSYSKLAKIVSIKNVHTVKNYVEYLRSSYLIVVLERFSFKLKQQILAPKKVYCIDNGVIEAVGFNIADLRGVLMENLTAIELQRRSSGYCSPTEIFYWKDYSQREVDFVVKEGQKVKQLIQVTYASEKTEVREREIKALLSASRELRCSNLLVITNDYEGEEKVNSKTVRYVPIWKWLLR
jgi:predicted AAA+ superfamily ATPase